MTPNDLLAQAAAARVKRFRIRRTPEGGVSIGFSSLDTYLQCGRKTFWAQFYDGVGLLPHRGEPDYKLLYGKLWHAVYEARLHGEDERFAYASGLAEDGLAIDAYADAFVELVRDMDWYWTQPKDMRASILHSEDELVARFGRHELRGTPDLVLSMEDAYGGGVVINDHKTFVALDKRNYVHVEPSESTMLRHLHSRQMPYYMGIWNQLHPDQLCTRGLINLVPQQVNRVNAVLDTRRGNVRRPEIKREFVLANLDQIADIIRGALQACDEIADALAEDAPLTHSAFKQSWKACVDGWGKMCPYIQLCEGRAQDRTMTAEMLYERVPVL